MAGDPRRDGDGPILLLRPVAHVPQYRAVTGRSNPADPRARRSPFLLFSIWGGPGAQAPGRRRLLLTPRRRSRLGWAGVEGRGGGRNGGEFRFFLVGKRPDRAWEFGPQEHGLDRVWSAPFEAMLVHHHLALLGGAQGVEFRC